MFGMMLDFRNEKAHFRRTNGLIELGMSKEGKISCDLGLYYFPKNQFLLKISENLEKK
jgi:hypothetical protein